MYNNVLFGYSIFIASIGLSILIATLFYNIDYFIRNRIKEKGVEKMNDKEYSDLKLDLEEIKDILLKIIENFKQGVEK